MTDERTDDLVDLVATANDDGALEHHEEPTIDVITLRVGSQWFAIRPLEVRQVTTLEMVTRVPSTPRWVLGVALVQSRLVSIIDLGALISQSPTSRERARLIVLDHPTLDVAIVAEEARGVIAVAEPTADASQHPCVVGRTTWDNHLVFMLDSESVIDAAALGGSA